MTTRTLAFRLSLAALALVGLASTTDAADGLAFVGRQQQKTAGLTGLRGVSAVAVSPDGGQVYVASAGSSTLTAFTRDPATGGLELLEQQVDNANGVDGLDHVRAIALAPDGTTLYAAGEADDAVAVFVRDPATGHLAFAGAQRNGVAGVTGLNGPRALLVSPDGAHLYVGSGADKALVAFRRDRTTGALKFVKAWFDAVDGMSGLNGIEQLATSADGATLYVAASGSDAVTALTRDPVSGVLAFLARYPHSTTTFDGLDGVKSILVTPDGRWVYAGGKLDDAIAVFARAADGTLTFANKVRNGLDGVAGLDAVEALAMSPDDTRLYAAASKSNSVATFAYDAGSGALTLLHVQQDGVGTIEGLGGAAALAISPDGASVYVAGTTTDAVDTFSTRCGDGFVDPDEQCDDGNAVDGDGCSAGCRRECEAAADCTDTDRCTTEICRNGECALPRCGLRGATCQLADALPTMLAIPPCLPLQRRLGGTIRTHLRQARAMVQLVRHPQPKTTKSGKRKTPKKTSPHALDTQLGKALTTIERKAAKLQQQGTISDTCLEAVTQTTEQLRSELGTSILAKGLCAQ